VGVTADLETYAGAIAAMRATQERFGRIDLLVNNVGGTIWAMPYAEYCEVQIEA
jgi:dihydroxycyclohexadiene carboxylate dehydrogenase